LVVFFGVKAWWQNRHGSTSVGAGRRALVEPGTDLAAQVACAIVNEGFARETRRGFFRLLVPGAQYVRGTPHYRRNFQNNP